MKYNALIIKSWIIKQISPMGWSMIVARSLPELLEVNPYFSAFMINKRTKWNDEELQIIQWYLKKMFDVRIPDDLLIENGTLIANFLNVGSINFLTGNTITFHRIKNSILNFLKF
ncbi:MAG: hypothetical protein RIC35_22725 [Marinoscillum sp.]